MKAKPITVAVITGGHSYDVMSFQRLFRSLDGVEAYIQHMDDFATSSEDKSRCSRIGILLSFIAFKSVWRPGKDQPEAEPLPESSRTCFSQASYISAISFTRSG